MAENLRGNGDKYYTGVLQTAVHSFCFQTLTKPTYTLSAVVLVLSN